MTEKKLTELLEQLHAELASSEVLDEKGRELLRAINKDIENLLNRSTMEQADESVMARLQDAIDHFEITHPALTSVLSNLITALGNAGF